ncbi:DUF1223 domain-containing protein [Pseudohoeflea coraliihabitans]|uniref:DUF1223 domain-containing protein n=1 Tax=Pseudohoeflea coraliihabitans TaxID=2860393 RepID=A0ABS6WNT2_9HYPH|nr:DUF1223 domain-containing protein [Pseudohoeflea sp. DP4N28-3]MBW3096734.1 DUF1223 domain-containing protein [Pseudohoeflea sp. DP4N28-3]
MPSSFTAALLGFLLIVLGTGTTASAKDSRLHGVVELFTSQACSSCPPADAELARLVAQGDVLALSYHVDYWNYLGWEDTLSSRANTERQKGYASRWELQSVYTPQAVINGRDHVNGADGRQIDSMLERFSRQEGPFSADVEMVRNGDAIVVSIGAASAAASQDEFGKADIVIVYFDTINTVSIGAGENGGKTITYRHSVRDMETIAMWSGDALTIDLPASVLRGQPGRNCAVLVQQVDETGRPGAILGAAMLPPDPASRQTPAGKP